MLIGLKGDNYYSKVFKRVNYKLWNNTFWVVITSASRFTEVEKIFLGFNLSNSLPLNFSNAITYIVTDN